MGCLKLSVKIVLGKEDVTGKRGRHYFKNYQVKEKCGKGVQIDLTEVKGRDHDKFVDPAMGIIVKMLREVKILRLVG